MGSNSRQSDFLAFAGSEPKIITPLQTLLEQKALREIRLKDHQKALNGRIQA